MVEWNIPCYSYDFHDLDATSLLFSFSSFALNPRYRVSQNYIDLRLRLAP